MKKWIILDLIFLVVFNAVFFLAGGIEHKASACISYYFIHFAYFMLLLTPRLIHRGKSAAIFGFSLYSISAAYFLLEFIIGVLFMLSSPDAYAAALLVQLTVAGIYGIVLISNMIANEHTANVEEKREYQIEYIKNASVVLKGLLERISDKEAKRKVERVYDALYSSPVKLHPSLAEMESQILMSIHELENEVSAENNARVVSLAASLLLSVNERNRQLKILN